MYRILTFIFFIAAAGCATAPDRAVPLQLDIEVAADANPDDRGRPSPVVLSIFELVQPERFNRCTYLSLLATPHKCLHEDLLGTHRTLAVAPGTQRIIELAAAPGSRHIGVVAEFVQFADAKNRINAPLSPTRSNRVKLRIDSRGIVMRSGDPPRQAIHSRFNDD